MSLRVLDSPDNDRLQTTEYFISYWQFTGAMKNLTIRRDPSGQTNVHLIDLNPTAPYNVRVVARNEPYYSQPADHVFVTLEEDDCIPTLQQVHAQPLMINWSYVCEGSQMLKEIASYVIVYKSPSDYHRLRVEMFVTEYSFCELLFNTTYNLSVTAVTRNGVLRKSNILSVLTNKYSDEVATVTASSDNTGLIAGVAILGILFVVSGLIALYLFCYIKRSGMIYIVHFHFLISVGLTSRIKILILVARLAKQASRWRCNQVFSMNQRRAYPEETQNSPVLPNTLRYHKQMTLNVHSLFSFCS